MKSKNFQLLKYLSILLAMMALLLLDGCKSDSASQVTIEKARFTVIDPGCIRIEYQKDGKFVDAPTFFAFNREARFNGPLIGRDGRVLTIDTGKLRLRYTADGKEFGPDNLQIDLLDDEAPIRQWKPGQVNEGNLGGTATTLDGAVGPIPMGKGLLSREGWYLHDDSKGHLLTRDWVKARDTDHGTDWYFFGHGLDYKRALKTFTSLSGKIPMPRKYVLGSWYSRYWPYSSDDYRAIVAEYEKNDFPIDVMVMDMDWHKDSWTGYSWNRLLLPDAEGLLKWFHSQNLAVTLNDHPFMGVLPHEDMYKDFMSAMGEAPTDKVIPFDAGNKRYLETFYDYTHVPRDKEGVDFWWLDWQQEPFTRSIPTLGNIAWLNTYYYQRSIRDGLRGQSFSRWGGWGDHRHPIHFSGDASSSFEMLEFEIPFTSTAGNVGCFFWSHDMGGHAGGRNEESYVRWIQFGALSAALRVHSTRDPLMDRRPWTYSQQALESMRISFHLRSKLFPYIYSSVWQSSSESVPLTRPMYFEYPEVEEAYQSPGQYLFGDALLVAPIVSAGIGENKVAQQTVWFPAGADWYNYFDGKKYSGDTRQTVMADINQFPLYFKGGMPVVMQPYTKRMASAPLKTAVIRIYPGDSGQSVLYEDDGVTTQYEKNRFATTQLSYRRNTTDQVSIEISPTQGEFDGQLRSRSYVFEFGATSCAQSVFVDGKMVSFEYDAIQKMNIVRVGERDIRWGTLVEVNF
jgi:alpha-glucosidase (family GH31 glycosyl hydrolase)